LRPLRTLVAALAAAAALARGPQQAAAQGAPSEWLESLRRVLPAAERFTDRQGDPPVFRAFRSDPAGGAEILAGYAFVTSDFSPEEMGFDGPIEVLVGMDTLGVLTGVHVLGYHESLRSSRGDFLATPGFQEQFSGKSVTDAFQVKRDVAGITGASISVGAMSRGIRNSARRVALSLGIGSIARASAAPLLDPVTIPVDQLARMSWTDMVLRGLVQQLRVLDKGRTAAGISLFFLRDPGIAELVIGPSIVADARARAGARAEERHWVVAGVDGPLGGGVNLARLELVQGEDTVRVADEDVLLFGPPREGKLDGQVTMTRIVLVDRAVDMSRPFTFLLDLRPALEVFRAEYPGARPGATATGPAGPGAAIEAADDSSASTVEAAPTAPVAVGATPDDSDATSAASPSQNSDPLDLTFAQDETLLSRTLAGTSWVRVGLLMCVLALAAVAFASKRARVRWISLAVTVIYLGVIDRGFLSVSHITSGIRVGPQVYLSDLPLLLLVAFTLLTTLLWGRVFCGYLCPFGVLQDVLDRVTPRRFKRELPQRVHERATLTKYGVLAIVLAPALVGSGVGIYQYFEPFGTVFFWSRSALLWAIAAALLAASVIIPRFYCRYVCPLGAALALASFLSPFRIARVEQCGVCKVCEQRCPTRAIRGARIDFAECVRCNVCETKLIEKAGVCRHEMSEVRSRLVTLKVVPPSGRVVAE
jgi:ferredoxin